MMRRSWREGQDEIRKDLKWEREQEKESKRRGEGEGFGREVSLLTFFTGRVGGIIQALIPVYI